MGRFWCDDPIGHRRQGERDVERHHVDHEMLRNRHHDDCAREYARGVERAQFDERMREEQREREDARERQELMERRQRAQWAEEERLEEAMREAWHAAEQAAQDFEAFIAELDAAEKLRRSREAVAARWRWARSFRAGARFPGSGR